MDGRPENWEELQHETIQRRKRVKELVKLADSAPNLRLAVVDSKDMPSNDPMLHADTRVWYAEKYRRVVKMEDK